MVTINCKMPNDKVISLSRSQVGIAPNFAMTNYSSQGKTRPYNPVHLDYCKSHQAATQHCQGQPLQKALYCFNPFHLPRCRVGCTDP